MMMSTTVLPINNRNSLHTEEEANPPSPDQGRSGNVTLSHSISISGVADFDRQGDNTTTDDDLAKPTLLPDQAAARNRAPPSPYASSFENVASAGKGARVLFATDEWFAAADNLIHDSDPFFDPDEYCEQGKVMDGWESRRRREAGHDWCVIELSGRARLVAVEIDTAHFTGNHAPAVSLELADLSSEQGTSMATRFPGIVPRLLHGCVRGTSMTPQQVHEAEAACRGVEWVEVLPKTALRPGVEATRMHFFALPTGSEGTHLRLNYYPDGGVARLRLWGNVIGDRPRPSPGPAYSPQVTGEVCTVVPHSSSTAATAPPSQLPYPHPELSLECRGGKELLCSNKHYGRPRNLIQPTLGKDMGDGWETARHPSRPSVLVKDSATNLVDSPLVDWCVLKLGSVAASGVSRIILDTRHFRGNYPESVQVQGCYLPTTDEDDERALLADGESSAIWFPLVKRCRMSPDSEHVFDAESNQIASATRPVSHVKVSIYPDGGLSRVRVYGAV